MTPLVRLSFSPHSDASTTSLMTECASDASASSSAATGLLTTAEPPSGGMWSRDEVLQRMNMAADALGLRVVYGYNAPGSEVKRCFDAVTEETWECGKNYMPFNYYQKCIKDPKMFAILAFDKNSDEDQPCCLFANWFAGRKGSPQNAVISLLWTKGDYRRRGYATFLVDFLSPFLMEHAVLQSGFADSPPAIAFYHTNNFDNSNIGTRYSISAEQLRYDAMRRSYVLLKELAKMSGSNKQQQEQEDSSSSSEASADKPMAKWLLQAEQNKPKRSRSGEENEVVSRQSKCPRLERECSSLSESEAESDSSVTSNRSKAWDFCSNLLGWKGVKA